MVAWYRLRAGLRHAWPGFLGLALLIALLGGLSMASIAGGRRTQSAYPRFLQAAQASDLTLSMFAANGSSTQVNSAVVSLIARLPHVKRVVTQQLFTALPVIPNKPPPAELANELLIEGSTDGMLTDVDRVAVVAGRRADPSKLDELMLTAGAERILHVHLGDQLPLAFYSPDQVSDPSFGSSVITPDRTIDAKVVGTVFLDNAVVQDDVDSVMGSVVLTPAAARFAGGDWNSAVDAITTVDGDRDVAAVQSALLPLLPNDVTYNFHTTAAIEVKVARSIRPITVALTVFGLIAGAVALLLAMQLIGRMLRDGNPDAIILQGLGAARGTLALDGLIGVLLAVIAGVVLAVGVAIGLSPLSPLGPIRPIDPGRGFFVDLTVIAAGAAVLVVVLAGGATLVAVRRTRAQQRMPRRSSRVGRIATWSSLPVSARAGVQFAFDGGPDSNAAPVRAMLGGTVVAVAVVMATLTFGGSLRALVDRPSLYGWNFSYAFLPSQGIPPATLTMLTHDDKVDAWVGYDIANAEIDGQNVPILLSTAEEGLSPAITSGHSLSGDDQIIVGKETLARLHKHLGDSVTVSYGSPDQAPIYVPPTKLTVVGIATMPALGYPSVIADHTSMGIGAILSVSVEPPALVAATTSDDPNLNGPDVALVRMRSDLSAADQRAEAQRIADDSVAILQKDPQTTGADVSVIGVQRPAEITNYQSTGATPVLLAGSLAAGAIVALALTLVASVRRRRHDLALLKSLGFTSRQLSVAVAWQASVAAVVGLIVGLPLGVVAGRQLWILFANSIDAVPRPIVPLSTVVLVAVGAVVVANLVSAIPARMAARTPAAKLLNAE